MACVSVLCGCGISLLPSPLPPVTGVVPCRPNGCGPGPLTLIVPDACLITCRSLCGWQSLVIPDWVQRILLGHPCREVLSLTGTIVSFKTPCDGHDRCYYECGVRTDCDVRLLENMMDACDAALPHGGLFDECKRSTCYDKARAYYRFVDLLGEPAWERACSNCGAAEVRALRLITPVTIADDGGTTHDERLAQLMAEPHARAFLAHITQSGDRDADGLPDEWETQSGLDPADPHDAIADYDDDGLTHLAEFLRDTDPFADSRAEEGIPAVVGAR